MQFVTKPPLCPRCQSPDSELIGQRRSVAPHSVGPEIDQLVYVYRCKCGLAFTHTAQAERLPPEPPTHFEG